MSDIVKDFLINFSNGESELGDGCIFVIDKVTDQGKGNKTFEVKRRDINVSRTPGLYLLKSLFGLKSFSGKDDVDKVRNAQFRSDNVLVRNDMAPRSIVVFPDRYDDLPQSFKDSIKWGPFFEMVYAGEAKIIADIEALKQKELSEAEIYNTITSSPSKYFEKMADTAKRLVDIKLQSEGIKGPDQSIKQLSNPLNS